MHHTEETVAVKIPQHSCDYFMRLISVRLCKPCDLTERSSDNGRLRLSEGQG